MPITLQSLLPTGETSYIAKHNSNYTVIQNAINQLMGQLVASASSALTLGTAFEALFGTTTAVIGKDSYRPTGSGSTLTVASGYVYRAGSAVVSNPGSQTIAFGALAAGTYYLHVDPGGTAYVDQVASEALYSIAWTGAAFGAITRLCEIVWAAADWIAAQTSTTLGPFDSLDDRLEAIEASIGGVVASAQPASAVYAGPVSGANAPPTFRQLVLDDLPAGVALLSDLPSLPVVEYTADLSSTADADPGAGLLRYNNATPTSSTVLFFDDNTADGVDLSTYFASLGASGFIKVMAAADEWQLWRWTAAPTEGTGYWKFTVTLQASMGTVDDTDALKVLFDVQGAGAGAGKHAIYIAAGSMRPSVTGGCAALAAVASAANQPDIVTLNFDPTTQEYAQFGVVMPKSWDEGTITFRAHWSHAETTTNFGVVWDLQAVAVSNDDAIAVAFGTAQTSTDTGGTANDLYASPESSAMTVSGTPAAEDMVFFRVSRVTGNGSDTMAIDARLHGITLYITTDAETDA